MQLNSELPSGWCWTTIDEIRAPGRALVSGPFGSNIGSRFFVETGVPVIRGNNLSLRAKRFIDNGFVFLTEEKAAEFPNCVAEPNDLVLTAAGTIGQVGIIPDDARFPRYIISNKQLRARLDSSVAIPLFVYYWLSSAAMAAYIQTRNTGSTIPLINLSVLKMLPVPLPPLDEQRAIVGVLDCIDSRIVALQKMNEILEAIARAIFKSWFVDFDPVKAKAEGREPEGMDAATAVLFPGEFQDSEFGPFPKGWKIGRLDDLLVLQRGFDLPHSQRTEGPYPVIAASGRSGTHTEYKVKGPGIVTGRSGVLGKVFYVNEDFWPLNTALWVKEFRGATPAYALRVLERLHFASYNAGSAVPTLNRNHVHGLKMLVPPPKIVAAFDEFATALHRRSRVADEQRESLSALRDALLPRLISGKLRVPQAEEMLAGVV